jgi:uncharacterized protein (TIGR00369 family)
VSDFTPKDPRFAERVHESFGRQTLMSTIGAELRSVEPGRVEVTLTPGPALAQQHGFVHAGVIATIADTACGYAAFSLMPPGSDVLSVEFKLNLLNPAAGDRLIATGTVIRAGRTLSVCEAEVHAQTGTERFLVAKMLATMIRREAEPL